MEICSYEEVAVWYEPDYRDNRDRPEGERMGVLLAPASRGEMQRLEERRGQLSRGGKINPTRRYNKMRVDVLTKCVREVDNLTLKRVLKEGRPEMVPITTGAELVRHAPEDLLEDILSALKDQSQLEDGLRGKFDSQSDSSA